MDDFNVSTLNQSKNEWGSRLVNILTPVMIEGLRSIFDLPMIYTTCFVKRDLIERLKQQTNNNFYFSIIPDIFSFSANDSSFIFHW